MTILWTMMVLFFISIALNIPMIRKPLSEDDGNWFYLPVFWKKGVRLFKGYENSGYFGVPWMAASLYNIIGLGKLTFFYLFKIVWYSLNSLSIYWLSYCLWHDPVLSFIAGLTFAIVTTIPNTLFVLTYAEHFFIFPINLCIIFVYYGITTGNSWYFLLAGLMSAWSVQIKTPALLFSILFPITFYYAPNILIDLTYYFLAFMGINILPIFIVKIQGGDPKLYLQRTFGPVLEIINLILTKLKLAFLINRIGNLSKHLTTGVYIESHHGKSLSVQWSSFKRFMLPAIRDLYIVLILASTQVVLLFIKLDHFSLLMFLLFIVFLLMQQVQKNYYTPHFNPCWAPISVLAAKTVWDMWPYLLNSGILGWAMIVFLGIELIKIGNIIVKSFSKSERNTFGYLGPMLGMLFRLPESIGQYIRQNSGESEKLFVWGDQPSIYLYAKREAFNPHTEYLIPYAHQGQILGIKELLHSIQEKPPELLIFYNYKVNDGWNIKRLQDTIGIPYNFLKSFKIADNQGRTIKTQNGIVLDFPLYRRDDNKYKEILLDRALLAKKNGNIDSAQKHLEDILEILPNSFEASIRLSMMRNNTCDVDSARNYLNKQSAENHNTVGNAILLRLRAEIEVATGNTDSALKNYEKSHSLNPNDFRIHNGLGGLYYSMGKLEEAFKSFQKALELHPYSSDVLNNIGVILSQAGKREDAVKCFQKALSLMPSNQDAINNYESIKSLSKATK
jgi:tetratricopeptide (TPR) repeat protein